MVTKKSISKRFGRFSEAKKLLVFLLAFIIIGGGYMAFRTFAYSGAAQVPYFPRFRFSTCVNWPCKSPSGFINEYRLKSELLDRIQDKPGPWHIKKAGSDWGPWLERQEASDRLVSQITNAAYGTEYYIQNEASSNPKSNKHPEIYLKVEKAKYRPSLMRTAGTQPVDVQHTALFTQSIDEGLGAKSVGIFSCRNIAGTNSWSQHAYGNAEDWRGTSVNMKKMAMFFRAHAAEMHVQTIIYNRKIWTRGQAAYNWENWSHYSGQDPHTSHVHIDMYPSKKGTPACAKNRAPLDTENDLRETEFGLDD